jgi:hypothetical protein
MNNRLIDQPYSYLVEGAGISCYSLVSGSTCNLHRVCRWIERLS